MHRQGQGKQHIEHVVGHLQGTALPEALVLGPGEVQGSMQGPHTNPAIQAAWKVPAAEASGQIKLDKDTMHLSAK